MNKNGELSFHITCTGHIFIKIKWNLGTGYKISETMQLGENSVEFVPPELANSMQWNKSFWTFAGWVWKHHGATEDARLKNVLADNCANLESKQVHRILRMLHISPCSHLPEDALCFFSLPFFFCSSHKGWGGGVAPEDASQLQSPWDELTTIARHYIIMVSHSLGLRVGNTCPNTPWPYLCMTAQQR